MTIYTKVCTKCRIEKPITEFNKDKSKPNGYKSACKSCEKEYRKKHNEDTKESRAEYNKQWREDNKESRAEYNKQYYDHNKETAKTYTKQYYKDNKEVVDKSNRQWRKSNKEAVKEWRNQYESKRKQDPLYKLICRTRSMISRVIKQWGFKKSSRTHQILGCSFEEFKIHIESQFTDGMSWDNYGEWHYDHKTPVSWALTQEEIIALNHYTNFQPLWAKDNLSKGNRFAH